jgi:hypothetical protein
MIVINRTHPPTTNFPNRIQILIVEDEKIIAINLKETLESLGYRVVAIAASGEKAVEKATELRPDLVLMDIRLKGDMDGIAAAQQIWENLEIPAIYVTGHSDQSTVERAKVSAPFGYILKPIKERELSVAIDIALQRYEREHLLSAILKGMTDGVIIVDKECRVKSLNQVAQALTGWQFSEARDRKLTEIFSLIDGQTQQPLDAPVTAALQNDTTVYMEDYLLLISNKGARIPITGNTTPIKDKQGTIIGVVVVFQDISDAVAAATQRKRVEAVIRQQLETERRLNQLQNRFIRTISHEYRTPLSIILACSQLLETNVDPHNKEKQLRNCQKIQNSVKYMVGMLEDLLTFNKAVSGELTFNPAPLEVCQFCSQLVEDYQLLTGDRHEIQFICCGKRTTAYVDEELLHKILGNLLSNALKYSPDGGTIHLSMACQDNQVIFQVRDPGIGIPLEDQPHIFEPFHRAANVDTIRGVGMGLAIVKRAVDLQGGAISLESEVGVGTTFTVTLPGDRI